MDPIINDIFCGESMFSIVNDAKSSFFFIFVIGQKRNSIKIIDCQVYNKHLESLEPMR